MHTKVVVRQRCPLAVGFSGRKGSQKGGFEKATRRQKQSTSAQAIQKWSQGEILVELYEFFCPSSHEAAVLPLDRCQKHVYSSIRMSSSLQSDSLGMVASVVKSPTMLCRRALSERALWLLLKHALSRVRPPWRAPHFGWGKLFTYSGIFLLTFGFFAYSRLGCLLDALSHCKQKTSIVSKQLQL